MASLRSAALVLVVAATGCGGPAAHQIVGTAEVPGGTGALKIHRVTDLGDIAVPRGRGALPAPASDGVFAVGELLLVDGAGFGQLPAVRIGGRAAPVVARTGAGGVVCRIPAGIDAGPTEVVVSTLSGRDATTIEVVRFGLVVDRAAQMVHVVALRRDAHGALAARLVSSMPVPGALAAGFSPDGRVAYVAANPTSPTDSPSLQILSMTAAGGPSVVRQKHLDLARITALAVAERAPVAAVAGAGKLVVLDLSRPRAPLAGTPFPLVGGAAQLAVSPDGARLVALSPEDNLLTPVALDRRAPYVGTVGQPVELASGQHEPMARDAAFTSAGDEAWVLCGAGPAVPGRPHHSMRLVIVSYDSGSARVDRSVELAATGAPDSMAVGQVDPAASAAAIRSLARRSPLVISTVNAAPGKPADRGHLVVAWREGRARRLGAWAVAFGRPQLTPDLGWVVVPVVRPAVGQGGGAPFQVGLVLEPLGPPGTASGAPAGSSASAPAFVRLGAGLSAELRAPPSFALSP